MAITQNTFTGDGSTVLFSFTFPYLDESHIKVSLNGSDTILYTLANATTIQMNTAPSNGVAVRIYRNTDSSLLEAQSFSGSSIRAQDLNDNFTQVLFKTQETENFAASTDSSAIAGTAASAVSTANTALSVANTANTTANGIAATANTALSNSTAAVTTANAANALAAAAVPSGVGAIVNADINASAAIVDTKLATIATAGKVSNSATTATDANTASAIVARSAAGNFNITSINNGPLAGMRNAIINGNFDTWQRGTSFSNPASSTYTADRWQVVWNGSGATRTVSQQAFTLGQTDVAGEPTYFIKYNQSVAGSGGTLNYLRQPIESVRTFAGQQVTVSFYAKAASATTMPVVSLAQFFGSGGSPSGNVFTDAASSVSITTSWQRFTYSVTLPSITGKTLGSDGNDWMGLIFGLPFNAAFNIDIAQVQVEPGPVATPFERRPIGTELALCQRYYYQPPVDVSNGVMFKHNQMGLLGRDLIGPTHFFPVTMRGIPTITFTDNVGNALRWTVGSVNNVSPGAGNVKFNSVRIRCDLSFNSIGQDRLTAEARNLTASAEL